MVLNLKSYAVLLYGSFRSTSRRVSKRKPRGGSGGPYMGSVSLVSSSFFSTFSVFQSYQLFLSRAAGEHLSARGRHNSEILEHCLNQCGRLLLRLSSSAQIKQTKRTVFLNHFSGRNFYLSQICLCLQLLQKTVFTIMCGRGVILICPSATFTLEQLWVSP